jgi:hypothetical protein
MTRLLAAALAAAALGAGVLAGGADAASPTGLSVCALGRLQSALRTFLPDAIAQRQRRLHASLRGLGADDRARVQATFAAGVAAYVYGYAPVTLRLTVQRFPVNQLVGIAQLATASARAIVAPNHDTLYSVSQLDLSGGRSCSMPR